MLRSLARRFASRGNDVASSRKEGEKAAAIEKAYHEVLLKNYLYKKPKDKRTAAEREAWKQEAKKWASFIGKKDWAFNQAEKDRERFIFEAIEQIPAGVLRDYAEMPDFDPFPMTMRAAVPADCGPIPDSEIERLVPTVIDMTQMQRDLNSISVDKREIDAEVAKIKAKKAEEEAAQAAGGAEPVKEKAAPVKKKAPEAAKKEAAPAAGKKGKD